MEASDPFRRVIYSLKSYDYESNDYRHDRSAADGARDKENRDAHGDWQKPWIADMTHGLPRNLRGTPYRAGNVLMLLFLSEIMGYRTPSL